ncbi:MAG: Hpt domain-containing protein [Gemmatimonadetes bacterium]|nr:Hpt domain-containing protein [Gemmatimonadota bacterium]
MGTGLLDFFVLEAGEYTEQLDGALARASGKMPDLDAFTRNARALRGSATMARIQGIAGVATGLERLGRGLRDGSLQWTPQLRSAIVAAIDDVKILVRNSRTWGTDDDARAAARLSELDTLAPAFQRRSVVTPMLAIGSGLWMASETGDIAVGLQRWSEQNVGVDAMAETIRRVRAMRGIAALADLPPIKDVIDAVDDAAKTLELGTVPGDTHRNLFKAAAALLREASEAVQGGRKPSTSSAAVSAFTAAAALMVVGTDDKDYVVPIATLFPDGGGDHLVHAAPNPPTTPEQRFRMEVVSQAEHLRRLIADARTAAEGPNRQRAANELRASTRALQRAAESFGESATALAVQALVEPAAALETRALDELDRVAMLLANPAAAPTAAATTAAVPTAAVPTAAATPTPAVTHVAVPVAPPAALPLTPATPPLAQPAAPPLPTPARPMRPAPSLAPTPYMGTAAISRATGAFVMPAPSGTSLEHALESGLTGLARLNDEPMAEPANIDEDDGVVPIQELVYRGRAALARAIEVGESIKSGGATPDQKTLAELFDLLELATTE